MKILNILIFCIIISTFAGCSENGNITNADSSSLHNINLNEEEKKQLERESQTLWTVLDKDGNDKEMLQSNNEDVNKIIDIIEKHCLTVDNRDFKDLDVEDEYDLYSYNFIKKLENENYKELVNNMYKDNKLVLNHKNLIWYRNYFNEDMTTCKVTIESEFVIDKANKDYLDKNKMNLDEVYQEKRVYYVEKLENEWKIVNIEKGALTKRNQAG
ncbi:hypothetical protein [Romboutsia sp. Marseille-P6047]|uniref:hypothetical protein n=1 Tax=Romboutsia sp. Marseille-P6047 TaxID=2161817 RepID=UPI0008213463|nr:hypothetical protein [Romboutsia sp. Marseille-P6047]SCI01532.1 Uncharacterised protein [uncultured Clostridium sp.]